ncbi:MAG: glycosyltransferase [Desulfotignum sp.]|nr:glycosyltransferase [Desulfotignum sp.]
MALLSSRGHEVHIGAGRKYSDFLSKAGYPYSVLPSIQEVDGSGFPTLEWFGDSAYIRHCIVAEADLLKRLRPDRVLGVFSFTLAVSSAIARVPFDGLICGCMLRASGDILGFHGDEKDILEQRANMDTFFHYAAQKINLSVNGLAPFKIKDARELLEGERTFLWDFPEFKDLPIRDDVFHVGPILYKDSRSSGRIHLPIFPDPGKTVVISFGTCSCHPGILMRLARICRGAGFRVVIAAGGYREYMDLFKSDSGVCVQLFPDLDEVLTEADLFISHGGQLSVFQALKARVPVMVMPFQPEQAHNGVCLERIGCGRLLVAPTPFQGNPRVYLNALDAVSDEEITDMMNYLYSDLDVRAKLVNTGRLLEQYSGAEQLVPILERA